MPLFNGHLSSDLVSNLAQLDPHLSTKTGPQVTLWTLFFDDCHDQGGLLDSYRALLSPEEIARMERFVFERHQLRHLMSRALVRVVLGQTLGVNPRDLVFDAGPQGKPVLAGAGRQAIDLARIAFNLAHTEDVAVLAVADTCLDLGVDVEATGRKVPLEVGMRQFAPIEAAQLRALAERRALAEQTECFWTLWTLKESLIKATGLGLSTPLDRFGFDLHGDDKERLGATCKGIALHSQPGTEEAAQPWWFGVWRPSAGHMASLCLARPPAPPWPQLPQLQARRIVPLQGDAPMPLDLIRQSAP